MRRPLLNSFNALSASTNIQDKGEELASDQVKDKGKELASDRVKEEEKESDLLRKARKSYKYLDPSAFEP